MLNKKQIENMLNKIPVLSTHQHHLESEKHRELDLQGVFSKSYVGWCSMPTGSSFEERQTWLDGIRTNSYFVWLEKAIKYIYNTEKITGENWDAISNKISEAHQEKDYHINLLKEKGNYIGLLEDCFWDTGSDVGYPGFITPVYRLDLWMTGFHPDSVNAIGCSIHQTFKESVSDFDTYLDKFKEEITRRRGNIAALKCAMAYERDLHFNEPNYSKAKSVYGKHPSKVSIQERRDFEDYMFHVGLKVAGDLDLPVQIHTGLAKLQGSDPLLLENVISGYPDVRFVLFHGGFPWIYNTAALAHNYANVIIDINWLPLISTSAAKDALHVYIETLRDNRRITWGADTWTSEEAVGAAMAFQHVLTDVLNEKVESGYFSINEAEKFAKKIMYQNAQEIYNL
ncbi:MAG TPA: amidohydrolase family protein [Virgibacillus sp.]|nr:amidohydrolase family protein [Virgibacillus sp.]HLR65701.1 amidohydrolase family protein [Virgibacillus sp.]